MLQQLVSPGNNLIESTVSVIVIWMTGELGEREGAGPSLLGIRKKVRSGSPMDEAGTGLEPFHHIAGNHGIGVESSQYANHLCIERSLRTVGHFVAEGSGWVLFQEMAGSHK